MGRRYVWIVSLLLGCPAAEEPGLGATESSGSSSSDDATPPLTTSDTLPPATTAPADGSTTAPLVDDTAESGASSSTGGRASSTGGSGSGSTSGDPSSTGPTTDCGNGVVEAGEECDGSDLDGSSCRSLGLPDGELACVEDSCVFDLRGCVRADACGDGRIQPGEQCDGADLQGFDCITLGLSDGTLSCDPVTCTFDTSNCNFGSSGTGG
jgi:hypothetical protein